MRFLQKSIKILSAIPYRGVPLNPKPLGQKEYVEQIRKKMIVFGVGPAGTGKPILQWQWQSLLSETKR